MTAPTGGQNENGRAKSTRPIHFQLMGVLSSGHFLLCPITQVQVFLHFAALITVFLSFPRLAVSLAEGVFGVFDGFVHELKRLHHGVYSFLGFFVSGKSANRARRAGRPFAKGCRIALHALLGYDTCVPPAFKISKKFLNAPKRRHPRSTPSRRVAEPTLTRAPRRFPALCQIQPAKCPPKPVCRRPPLERQFAFAQPSED